MTFQQVYHSVGNEELGVRKAMLDGANKLPAGVKRFTGLYRFISPDSYQQWGIDPEDVPIGAIAAENHPPFLPDRFGGNAYGLGLYEAGLLSPEEQDLIDSLDMAEPEQIKDNYRPLNDIYKSLGLLLRYSKTGHMYYLIPRQFVAHFLVELQALTDEIDDFIKDLLARKLRETLRVGLVLNDAELLMPELQARMAHIDFCVAPSLEAILAEKGRCGAVVIVGDPVEVFVESLARQGRGQPENHRQREALGHFVSGLVYDMLEQDGELLSLCEAPLSSTREVVDVTFKDIEDLKRFLLFGHVYRTRRHYSGSDGLSQTINRFDFEAFMVGLGLYHETANEMLGGRTAKDVSLAEIDSMPYQDLPLPRGSVERQLAGWRRWFGSFFHLDRLDTSLPEVQRAEWENRYEVDGGFPDTLIVMQGRRRRPPLTLAGLEGQTMWRHLAGCRRELLAEYKDSFAYVDQVLEFLNQVRGGEVDGLPGLELSRLRKPFDNIGKHTQFKDVLRLVEMAPRLRRIEQRLNPGGILGRRTPMLENLAKLSLMGLEEGLLDQLYLIVLGHSTMSRVTFGKLPESSMRPLTDLGRYRDLDEAIDILRLYRLLSVAESVAANKQGLSHQQVAELFNLYDQAVRVVTDEDLDWDVVLDAQISRSGGVQAKATRKMLKIFNLFSYLEDWRTLEEAGPRLKEVMADFEPKKLRDIRQVVELVQRMALFVGAHYTADSTARPYFFRALLNSELHGTGRLLPRLGTAAGFTLLWVCVNASQRRLLNFNPLLRVKDEAGLSERIDKLRRALLGMDPQALSPKWLAGLRDDMARDGEAYIGDSGLLLRIDRETGALTPLFFDAAEEVALLEKDMARAAGRPLAELSDQNLVDMEARAATAGRFFAAQEAPSEAVARLGQRFGATMDSLEKYGLDQLFNLADFADNWGRLIHLCPTLAGRLLPGRGHDTMVEGRLRATQKLSALFLKDLNRFQDMELSHELARQEFGPTTAGVVGVSRSQFQSLVSTMGQIIERRPDFDRLMMLAVLIFKPSQPGEGWYRAFMEGLAQRVGLSDDLLGDLTFLGQYLDVHRQVIMGEACLSGLEPVLMRQDPLLVEALFLLSVVRTASIREGFLTEDLMHSFLRLQEKIRTLARRGQSAHQAHMEEIKAHACQVVAFDYYQEVQEQVAPTVSLRQLLETTTLPTENTELYLARGRRLAGLDRLLKLRDLLLVDALDLQMYLHQVQPAYIYRLKGLRSVGPTHFERDLFEGLRLYRGLGTLPEPSQHWLLGSLADPDNPLRLMGFRWAASRLNYENQIRLLLLGLAAARRLRRSVQGALTVNFLPLAEVMKRRFELVNEAFSAMSPEMLLNSEDGLEEAVVRLDVIRVEMDEAVGEVRLHLSDSASLERKITALREAPDAHTLKNLFHEELRDLRLTTHRNLDYQQQLEAAYESALSRLGYFMLERVRGEMAAKHDLGELVELFNEAWEQGLELPLSRDRQQSLRDLFDFNLERLRGDIFNDINASLNTVVTLPQLDILWEQTKHRLKDKQRWLGKDFLQQVAARFDRRSAAIRSSEPPETTDPAGL